MNSSVSLTPVSPSVAQIEHAMLLVQDAAKLFQNGMISEACQALETVNLEVPNLPGVNLLLAKYQRAQGNPRKAIQAALVEYLQHPENKQAEAFMQEVYFSRLTHTFAADFKGGVSPKTWPSISLFMIVKNEAENLNRCLDLVKDLVSEMVIVDTGSTDNTVEIARSYGAKVYPFTWCDDFAAARNEALKYATQDWLLMMDADNWLNPEDQNRLKWAAATGKADIYICNQLTWKTTESYSEDSQVRLFKNRLNIYYESPLHETIIPSATKKRLIIHSTNICIQHKKHAVESPETYAKKFDRNFQVINQAVEKDPSNIFCKLLKGTMLYHYNQTADAAAVLGPVLENLPEDYIPDLHLRSAHQLMINYFASQGDLDKAAWAVNQLIADGVDLFWVWAFAGSVYLNLLNNPETALVLLNHAKSLSIISWDPILLQTNEPQTYLLHSHLRANIYTGRLEEARNLIGKRHGTVSDKKTKAIRQQAENWLKDQRYQEVITLAAPHARQSPGFARIKGAAEAGLGQWHNAVNSMAMVIALEERPLEDDWAQLAQYEMNRGFPGCSLRAYEAGIKAYPGSAKLALAAGNPALKLKETDMTVGSFVEAFLSDPSHPEIGEKLQQIAETVNLTPVQIVRKQGLEWVRFEEFKKAQAAMAYVVAETPEDHQAAQMYAMLQKYN